MDEEEEEDTQITDEDEEDEGGEDEDNEQRPKPKIMGSKGGGKTGAFRPQYGALARVVATVASTCRVTLMSGTLTAKAEKTILYDLGLQNSHKRVFKPIDNPKLFYGVEQVGSAHLDVDWLLPKLQSHEQWRATGGEGESPCPIMYLLCASMGAPIALFNALFSALYGSKTRSHLRMCIGLYTRATEPVIRDYYLSEFAKGKLSRIRLLFATDKVSAGMDWPWMDIVLVWKAGYNLNRVMQAFNRTGRFTMETIG